MAMIQAKEAGTMSYQIPMLTATNYPVWAIKVKSILDAHGLLETVEPRNLGEEPDAKKSKHALAYLLQVIPEEMVLQMSGRGDKSGFRCYDCGNFGHFSCECTKWYDKDKEANLIQEEEPTLL